MPNHISKTDPEIAAILQQETERQESGLELIASENCVSQAVMDAQGSVLTNKYAEGYPPKDITGVVAMSMLQKISPLKERDLFRLSMSMSSLIQALKPTWPSLWLS